MNITLKSVKYNNALSRDSHCFSATVYVDGKKVFGIMDDGWGGDMEPFKVKGGVEDLWATYKAIDAELKKEPRVQTEKHIELGLPVLDNCLEFIVCDLVNDFLRDREIKKSLRRITYMVGDEMFEVKLSPTADNIKRIKAQKWWDNTNVLLNGMPIEEVRQYFN